MKKPSLPKKLARTSIYKSNWINLFTDRVQLPSGKIIDKYHMLDYPNQSVVVLVTNQKQEICFIKALRYTTQTIEWELPAGGIDPNETVLTAAKREFFEETGFETTQLELMYSFNPSNGMSNQVIHLAKGILKNDNQANFDTDEVKGVFWLNKKQVLKLIAAKEIRDGLSLIGVLLSLLK